MFINLNVLKHHIRDFLKKFLKYHLCKKVSKKSVNGTVVRRLGPNKYFYAVLYDTSFGRHLFALVYWKKDGVSRIYKYLSGSKSCLYVCFSGGIKTCYLCNTEAPFISNNRTSHF